MLSEIVIDGFDTMLFVVGVIALGKLVIGLTTYKLPEGFWAATHVVLVSFFTSLGAILGVFEIDLELGVIFSSATNIVEVISSLLIVLVGSGLFYWTARKVGVPVVGYSRTDAALKAGG